MRIDFIHSLTFVFNKNYSAIIIKNIYEFKPSVFPKLYYIYRNLYFNYTLFNKIMIYSF